MTQANEVMNITEVCCKPIMTAHHDDEGAAAASKLSDYEVLQLEHQNALEALRQLAEGVRIVTRQMKQQHADDNDSVATSSTIDTATTTPTRTRTYSGDSNSVLSSVVSEDDRRLNDLSHTLEGVIGADLLGLSQAAQMVNEHARLASQEASVLTDDMADAGQTAEEALERAVKAEKAVTILHREKKNLQKQLESKRVERRVLAKEVKVLRKENTTLKQLQQDYERQDVLLALEQHVRGALEVHEQQLAMANTRNLADKEDVAAEESSKPENTVTTAEEPIAEEDTAAEEPAELSINETPAPDSAVTKEEQPAGSVNEQEKPLEAEFVDVDETDAKSAMLESINTESSKGRNVGFAGAALGFVNKKKKSLQVATQKLTLVPQISLESPTASTVATEISTPPKDVEPSNKNIQENVDKKHHSRELSGGGGGGYFMGELTSATSTFANFFASAGPERVYRAPAIRKPAKVHVMPVNKRQLSVDVPPSVTTSSSPSLLSPIAPEDSPMAAAARHMDLPCDEQVLRSLSLPQQDTAADQPRIAYAIAASS